MILVREVFQAKHGKGDERVAICIEGTGMWRDATGLPSRLLTDASGAFFTVVWETKMESLGTWEETLASTFGEAAFGEWLDRMVPLVDSGRREFFTIVG